MSTLEKYLAITIVTILLLTLLFGASYHFLLI